MVTEAEVTLNGVVSRIPIQPQQSILDAVRAAGLLPPFSCLSGVCGTCRAQLAAGKVAMRSRSALSDAEIARGEILACQALPTTDKIAVRFQTPARR